MNTVWFAVGLVLLLMIGAALTPDERTNGIPIFTYAMAIMAGVIMLAILWMG